jgi:hypothetical protein
MTTKRTFRFHINNSSPRETEVQMAHLDEFENIPTVGGKKGVVSEAIESDSEHAGRLTFHADGKSASGTGATSLSVPKHMWETGKAHVGMDERNAARAEVYGSEHREPLGIGEVERKHKDALKEHFALPKSEQIAREKAAVAKLKAAKHLGSDGRTTADSEKTDSIKHEHDENGKNYNASACKHVAGHAVYTSGAGEEQKHHILNTCPGQTSGCGGGVDSSGKADVRKGACFAHNAEVQYPHAAVNRAANTQAMHDPAMTHDWLLSHVHSVRNDAEKSDKSNQRHVVRPNTLAENDRSTRHVLKHLNAQRKSEGKDSVISYQYSKTNALNDPENDHHVTYSNTGPKVKNGGTIAENVGRDKTRVRQTITSTDSNNEKIKNDEGKEVPAKHSYVVHNLRRGGEEESEFAKHVKSARYWDSGTKEEHQTEAEKSLPSEGHYDHEGKPTDAEHAHTGHMKVNGTLYKYHRQHVLHGLNRVVKVNGHDTPSDARFKDDAYLPKDRYKSSKGVHGAIVATSPTLSTNLDKTAKSEFTHDAKGVAEKAKHNGGVWDIDHPHDQEAAKGKVYSQATPVDISGLKSKKKKV